MGALLAELDAELWPLTAVRLLGVVIGVWGAVLVSPEAAREVGRTVVRWVASLPGRIGRVLGRKRRQPFVHPMSGSAHGTIVITGRAEGVTWSEEASEQILILKARTEALSAEVSELRREHGDRIAGLDRRLGDVMAEYAAAQSRLRVEQENRDRKALRINVRGLPLIGTSIILSGLPDPLAGHAWLGGFLFGGGLVVLLAVASSGRKGATTEA